MNVRLKRLLPSASFLREVKDGRRILLFSGFMGDNQKEMIPRFPYEEPFDEELTDAEKRIINDGVKHREDGYFHDENPWNEGTRQHKLWLQGWTDQDMIEINEPDGKGA